MKVFEIVLLVIYLLICPVLISIEFPGAEPIMVLSFLILMLSYAFFSWALFKKNSEQNTAHSILFGLGFSLEMLGCLFKQMLWPMSGFIILLGLIIIAVIGIITYQKINSNQLKAYYKGILVRCIVIGLIGIFWFLFPSDTLIQHKEKLQEKYDAKE